MHSKLSRLSAQPVVAGLCSGSSAHVQSAHVHVQCVSPSLQAHFKRLLCPDAQSSVAPSSVVPSSPPAYIHAAAGIGVPVTAAGTLFVTLVVVQRPMQPSPDRIIVGVWS